jgi:hypothetical protein
MRALFILFLSIFLLGCKKDPGEGGLASITGKLLIREYNGNCSDLQYEYYAVDEPVYIIAGDEPSYFERVRTGPDGTFWFQYLRKGKYTVYALTEDCRFNSESGDVEMIEGNTPEAVEVMVEITERKEELVMNDIIVFR